MSKPRLPRRSSDDDPTGIRELLASLPDPGPMPPELAERIAARLEDEQSLRSGFGDHTALGRKTSRPRLAGWLAAAAAAVIVGTLGASLLTRAEEPAPPAALGADFARSPSSKADLNRVPSPSPQHKAAVSSPLPTIIRMSGDTYSPTDLATKARSLRSVTAPSQAAAGGSDSGQEPLGTPEGVAACLKKVGAAAAGRTWVDLAYFGKTPAAVIVTSEGPHTLVRVVKRSCPGAQLLAGPAPLS